MLQRTMDKGDTARKCDQGLIKKHSPFAQSGGSKYGILKL